MLTSPKVAAIEDGRFHCGLAQSCWQNEYYARRSSSVEPDKSVCTTFGVPRTLRLFQIAWSQLRVRYGYPLLRQNAFTRLLIFG